MGQTALETSPLGGKSGGAETERPVMTREEFLEEARLNALSMRVEGCRTVVSRHGAGGATFAVYHADGRIMDVSASPPAPTDFAEAAKALSIG